MADSRCGFLRSGRRGGAGGERARARGLAHPRPGGGRTAPAAQGVARRVGRVDAVLHEDAELLLEAVAGVGGAHVVALGAPPEPDVLRREGPAWLGASARARGCGCGCGARETARARCLRTSPRSLECCACRKPRMGSATEHLATPTMSRTVLLVQCAPHASQLTSHRSTRAVRLARHSSTSSPASAASRCRANLNSLRGTHGQGQLGVARVHVRVWGLSRSKRAKTPDQAGSCT